MQLCRTTRQTACNVRNWIPVLLIVEDSVCKWMELSILATPKEKQTNARYFDWTFEPRLAYVCRVVRSTSILSSSIFPAVKRAVYGFTTLLLGSSVHCLPATHSRSTGTVLWRSFSRRLHPRT